MHLQVLSSLQRLHEAKPKPCCAVLCCENALILWDTDDQHVGSTFSQLQTGIAALDQTNFADVQGMKPVPVLGTTQSSRLGRNMLVTAMASLAAALACFIALAVLVSPVLLITPSALTPHAQDATVPYQEVVSLVLSAGHALLSSGVALTVVMMRCLGVCHEAVESCWHSMS